MTYKSTGFGIDWFDFDHDGWLDLFMSNGAVTVIEELHAQGDTYPFEQPNLLLRNLAGARLENVSASAGSPLALEEVSRGAAFGDIDNDGDIDILLHNNNGRPRLYINEIGNRKPWMMFELRGTESNRQGLGARVGLEREGQPTLWRRAHTDSSYCSSSDPRVHFGLGEGAAAAVVVQWPNGGTERWEAPAVNEQTILEQGTGVSR